MMNTDEDEVTAWQHSETYPLSQYAAHARLHTFRKLIIFKLTQYRNVFWFDSDTEIRSNLTEYYLTLPTDRDAIISDFTTNECNDVFNSGVMVVRETEGALQSSRFAAQPKPLTPTARVGVTIGAPIAAPVRRPDDHLAQRQLPIQLRREAPRLPRRRLPHETRSGKRHRAGRADRVLPPTPGQLPQPG